MAEGYGPMLLRAFADNQREAPWALYPETPPDTVAASGGFVLYQGIGGVPTYFTEGRMSDKANQRVQLEGWSKTAAERYRMGRFFLALAAAHPDMLPLGEVTDDYDPAVRLYVARVDIAVWYSATYPQINIT